MPKGKPQRRTRIRQQGSGSVYWNKAKERYQAVVELGLSADGRRIRKVYTAREAGDTAVGKGECERWLAQAQADALAGTLRPPSPETVQGFLEEWVKDKAALRWGVRHAQEVPRKLELYVYPVIGKVRLNDLDAGHIRRVLTAMVRKRGRTGQPLARQTQLHVHRILHSALGDRIRWQEVDAPTVKRRPADLPAPETVAAVLQDALQERYGLVFVLMGTAALRPGEVLGLRRADLDFERSTVTVAEAMITRGEHKGTAKAAKTEESHRTLELPAETTAALRAYCEERAEAQLRAGRVFCTDDGTAIGIDLLYPVWRRLLAARSVPYFRPYDLRHFAASFWLDEGLSLASVSAALGHSTQTTTARVYSHVLRRSEGRIAQASGKLLRLVQPPDGAADGVK